MNYRQVHLDFHTSEKIAGIGEAFSKENFQKALFIGHVNSITLFAKCHHGWAYYDSAVNEIHPNLTFDLLGEQIHAAHEIGVKTPVYLSAGFDEKIALRHPEWLVRTKEDNTIWTETFLEPGYHKLCIHSPYLDYLLEQIKEVCQRYEADGIFLDIVGVQPCYCKYCMEAMLGEGLNPLEEKQVISFAEKVYANYTKRVRSTIDSVCKDLPVFHNGGHIRRGRRDLAYSNTHLELESLPTGGWGYDHFPLSAAYAKTLDIEYLGMTGKFHTSWGEFGGFKHPNALRYEAALSIANGAGVSIGDQLHPAGEMDMATYEIIGKTYGEVKEKEPWLMEAKQLADIAVLSVEAVRNKQNSLEDCSEKSDVGAIRILQEGHYLFHVIDCEANFSQYKVILLPDRITLDDFLQDKLGQYVKEGGKVLATGLSGSSHSRIEDENRTFVLDFGVEYLGKSEYSPEYYRPNEPLLDIEKAAFVMYSQGYCIKNKNGQELGSREYPYFNRSPFAFCSHLHTPSSNDYAGPGMVLGRDGIYIAWEAFKDYAETGSLVLKRMVQYALDMLLDHKQMLQTDFMSQGIVTLAKQRNQYIAHLLYASPVKRGTDIEVIEDIPPIYQVKLFLNVKEVIKRVYLAPQQEEISFRLVGEGIEMVIPKVDLHQMIVFEY